MLGQNSVRRDGPERGNPVARLFALPNEHPAKTIMIALILCLVCSALVSTTAILLKPRILLNEEVLSKQREILRVLGRYQTGENISAAFSEVETRLIELATGEYVSHIDASSYNYDKAILVPATRVEIKPQDDIAKVSAIARYAPVYLFKKQGITTHIVVPVYGTGMWSTMRAYLALESDGNHISGISFYKHGETPGLGGEITNPRWQAKWQGKRVFDAQGQVRFMLSKVANSDPATAKFQVDAIAGATITSDGVSNLIRFWLGDQGYGPYFKRHFRQKGDA